MLKKKSGIRLSPLATQRDINQSCDNTRNFPKHPINYDH